MSEQTKNKLAQAVYLSRRFAKINTSNSKIHTIEDCSDKFKPITKTNKNKILKELENTKFGILD